MVSSDLLRLKQVLVNLISHSLSKMKNGFIFITTSLVYLQKTKNWAIEISVRDTSKGYNLNKQSDLFCLEESSKSYSESTLGLFISKLVI